MNHPYHNQQLFEAPDVCYQNYPNTPLEQPYIHSAFLIVQETPSDRTSKSSNESKTKLSELKFKIESVGIHPEDDDDLDMCPARVRPGWPEKIIPWWIPLNDYEKPPYSYATLIAHAILSSKDGRLTLNDIYVWISDHYPTFVLGVGGWQNSIRHNLSLNKKWFLKIDRRPTQANPGKGCYWTLVAGTEHIFIDNLTQEGGHNRKHHDIGLTTELSMGQRRGACFYNTVNTPSMNSSHNTKDISVHVPHQNTTFENNHGLTTPPPTPTKPELNRPLLSPLYTTFRMVSEKSPESVVPTKKRARKRISRRTSTTDESEYDSGVDLGNEYVECENLQKRCRRASSPAELLQEPLSYDPSLLNAENYFPLFDWYEKQPNEMVVNQFPPIDWSQAYPWEIVPDEKQYPITIDLGNDELSQKYLHFREDDIMPSPYSLYPSNPTPYVSMQDILYS